MRDLSLQLIVVTISFAVICHSTSLADDDLGNDKNRPIATITRPLLSSFAISPDGKTLATIDAGRVTLWDVNSGNLLQVLFEDEFKGGQVAFSPDGKVLAIAGATSQLELWDIEQQEFIKAIHACDGFPTHASAAAYSGDGNRIVATLVKLVPMPNDTFISRYGILSYDTSTGRAECLPTKDHTPYLRLAMSPNGKEMALATQGVGIWDLNAGVERTRLGKTLHVLSVAYSRDGKWIAAGCVDRIVVWEAATGDEKVSMKRPGMGAVISITFSPDNRRLVAGENDGPIANRVRGKWCVWNVGNGGVETVLPNQVDDVRHLEFTADGKRLISANDVGKIYVFDTSKWPEPQTGAP